MEQSLSREEQLALKNKRAGMAIFQISWILVFFALIWANFGLRGQQSTWPPPGVERYETGLPIIASALLVISGFTVWNGLKAVKAGAMERFLPLWRLTLLLGLIFVGIMGYEWLNTPASGNYGMLLRVMVGFHAIHALVIGAFLWNVHQNRARYNPVNFWPVEAAAQLWYFVVVAWLLFFVVLYII
jgi:cytochrome c oxidase subunit 3